MIAMLEHSQKSRPLVNAVRSHSKQSVHLGRKAMLMTACAMRQAAELPMTCWMTSSTKLPPLTAQPSGSALRAHASHMPSCLRHPSWQRSHLQHLAGSVAGPGDMTPPCHLVSPGKSSTQQVRWVSFAIKALCKCAECVGYLKM